MKGSLFRRWGVLLLFDSEPSQFRAGLVRGNGQDVRAARQIHLKARQRRSGDRLPGNDASALDRKSTCFGAIDL